jgi:hypothetical protein
VSAIIGAIDALLDDKQKIGIGGFTLEARIKETVTYTADVPEIPLENGSKAHDHIILTPLRIDIEGSVANVVVEPSALVQAFINASRTIGAITKFMPARTQAQITQINAMVLAFRDTLEKLDGFLGAAGAVAQMAGFISGPGAPPTIEFMDTMRKLYEERKPFDLEIYGQNNGFSYGYYNMFMTSWVTEFDNEQDGLVYKMSLVQLKFIETEFETVAAPDASPAVKDSTEGEKTGNTSVAKAALSK